MSSIIISGNKCHVYVESLFESSQAVVGPDSVLLYVKHFDPLTKVNEFMGSFVANDDQLLSNHSSELCKIVGLPSDTPLLMFKEHSASSVDELDQQQTFAQSDLKSGSVICVQEVVPQDGSQVLSLTNFLALKNGRHVVRLFKQIDDNSSIFHWKISNYSALGTEKILSPVVHVGGHPWHFVCFPKGNDNNSLGAFVDVADRSELLGSWSRAVHFYIKVVNQKDPSKQIRQDTQTKYTEKSSDWGFKDLITLQKLQDPEAGWLVDDSVLLEISLCVVKQPSSWSEWEETLKYLQIRVVTDSVLKLRQGTGLFDSWTVAFLKAKHSDSIALMKSKIEEFHGILASKQRLWLFDGSTQNQCKLGDAPFADDTVVEKCLESRLNQDAVTKNGIYVETSQTELKPFDSDSILLFVKYFNYASKTTQYQGSLVVRKTDTLSSISRELLQLAGLPEHIDVLAFKESTLEPIASDVPFQLTNVCHGDIIVFQKARSDPSQPENSGETSSATTEFCTIPQVLGKTAAQGLYLHKQTNENSAVWRWRLTNFSQLGPKVFSPDFEVGDQPWKLICFTQGIERRSLGVFLDVANRTPTFTPWSCNAKFHIKLINQKTPTEIKQETKNRFTHLGADWGFKDLILLGRLQDPAEGWLVDDSVLLEISLEVLKESYGWSEWTASLRFLQIHIVTDQDMLSHKGSGLFDEQGTKSLKTIKIEKSSQIKEIMDRINEHPVPSGNQRLWLCTKRQNGTLRFDTCLGDDEASIEQVFQTNAQQKDFANNFIYAETVSSAEESKRMVDGSILLFVKNYDPKTQGFSSLGSLVVNVESTCTELHSLIVQRAKWGKSSQLQIFEEVTPDLNMLLPTDKLVKDCGLRNGDILIIHENEKDGVPLKYELAPSMSEILAGKKTGSDLWQEVLDNSPVLDFTLNIESDSSTIGVHKHILESRSGFFSALFSSQMSDSKIQEFSVEHVSKETFTKFLKFLYLENISFCDPRDFGELFYLGKFYSCPDFCQKVLDSLLSDTLLSAIECACAFDSNQDLLSFHFRAIVSNRFHVLPLPSLSGLSPEAAGLLLKIAAKNWCTALECFKFFGKWVMANNQEEENHLSHNQKNISCGGSSQQENMLPTRDSFWEIAKFVPWDRMSVDQFENWVVPSGLFDQNVLRALQSMISRDWPSLTPVLSSHTFASIPPISVATIPTNNLFILCQSQQISFFEKEGLFNASEMPADVKTKDLPCSASGQICIFEEKHQVFVPCESTIEIFDYLSRNHVSSIPYSLFGKRVSSLCLDSFKNEIHATDCEDHCVKVLDCDGKFLRSYGSFGSEPGQLDTPCGIAIDEDQGVAYVVDQKHARITAFSLQDGSFVRIFGTVDGDSGFKFGTSDVKSICVSPKTGHIAVSDNSSDAKNIQIVRRGGELAASFDGFQEVSGVCFGENDELFAIVKVEDQWKVCRL